MAVEEHPADGRKIVHNKNCRLTHFSCLLALLLTSCDEILSVVTCNKEGEKVVNNYISIYGDKVYDETSSIKSWTDLDVFDDGLFDIDDMDDLLFKIENKKEQIVVLGTEEAALEISFFDGGYNYTLFSSAESLNNAINSSFDF